MDKGDELDKADGSQTGCRTHHNGQQEQQSTLPGGQPVKKLGKEMTLYTLG